MINKLIRNLYLEKKSNHKKKYQNKIVSETKKVKISDKNEKFKSLKDNLKLSVGNRDHNKSIVRSIHDLQFYLQHVENLFHFAVFILANQISLFNKKMIFDV